MCRRSESRNAREWRPAKLILFLLIWISGIAYLLYFLWDKASGSGNLLSTVVLVHTGAAFAILAFVIVHIYVFTTGPSFVDHVKPMVTGFEAVKLSPEEEAYEGDEPGHIR